MGKEKMITCPVCEGKGIVTQKDHTPVEIPRKCDKCGKKMALDKQYNLDWVCSCGFKTRMTQNEHIRIKYLEEKGRVVGAKK